MRKKKSPTPPAPLPCAPKGGVLFVLCSFVLLKGRARGRGGKGVKGKIVFFYEPTQNSSNIHLSIELI